jgi:hypothetical protein
MRASRLPAAGVALAAAALLALPAGAAESAMAATHHPRPASPAAVVPQSSSVNAAFGQLITALRTAPAGSIKPGAYRSFLITRAEAAQRRADDGKDCVAIAALAGLHFDLIRVVHIVEGPIRLKPGVAVELSADVLNVQALLESLPGAAACGGVRSGSPAVQPVAALTSAGTTQVRFRVLFPAPRFTVETGRGQRYLEMWSPGMGYLSPVFDGKQADQNRTTPGGSAVGRPDLPGVSEMLAVPQGSSVSVRVVGSTGYQLPGVQLWPVQESAPASVGNGPLPRSPFPFVINKAAYASAASFPQKAAIAQVPGSMHGLRTVSVSLAGGSYRPAKRDLTVLTSVTVAVTFSSTVKGNVFGPSTLISPWDEAFQNIWQQNLLNYGSVVKGLTNAPPNFNLCGEQMIMITASELQKAADSYAADRTADGILTSVFLTGPPSAGGIGTTAVQIRNFIASQYDSNCAIRPSYVLLLGDTSLVPTFEISFGLHSSGGKEVPNWFDEEDPIATDMPYGFIHQAAQVDASLGSGHVNAITDYNQDLLVGRVPVDASSPDPDAAAQAELDSLHAYEDSPPPATSSFYNSVTGAEFFQPCPTIQTDCGRTASPPAPVAPSTQDEESFLRSSEQVGLFAEFASKTFHHVDSDEANNDPGVTITPKTYDNGVAIPPGINWNGDAADITAQVNAGTFLLWHSDHGYTDGTGWYEPGFGTFNAESVSPPGTALPVVWSSDCDSGKFDSATLGSLPYTISGPEPSFGEAWLETEHAAGFVGASRVSPIFQDGFMLEGMGDSIFPTERNILAALFGIPPVQPVTELGALLDAAKLYMEQETTADMATDIGAQGSALEYNDLGDPSMPIWINPPVPYIPKFGTGAVTAPGVVTVRDAQPGVNGTVVVLRINGQVLGGGILSNGTATIPVSPGLDSLQGVTATLVKDGYLSATVSLGG